MQRVRKAETPACILILIGVLAACSEGRRGESSTGAAEVVTVRFTTPSEDGAHLAADAVLAWTAVDDAESYELHIGTSPGAYDVLNSGEIHVVSIPVEGMPAGATLHARIHVKHNGELSWTDRTFTVTPTAILHTPSNPDAYDVREPLSWTVVGGAEAYYLYIGTEPGLKDLIDGGEQQESSYQIQNLPPGATLHVRLHTKFGGAWSRHDATLRVSEAAQLIEPQHRAEGIRPQFVNVTWQAAPGASAYRVRVGSLPGAGDLFESDSMTSQSLSLPPLPGGRDIYVDLETQMGGVWLKSASSFRTAAIAILTSPKPNSVANANPVRFVWNGVDGAERYRIEVGTAPGASNLYSADLARPEALELNLPIGPLIYARLRTEIDRVWRSDLTVFTLADHADAAELISPDPGTSGTTVLDPSVGFEWSAVPLARGYRLQIGDAPGANNVFDSGLLHVTRRFVAALQPGATYWATVATDFEGHLETTASVGFEAGPYSEDPDAVMEAALWATGRVRETASSNNVAVPNSLLETSVFSSGADFADCTDYSRALRAYIQQMDPTIQTRELGVCLNPNRYDCHTLVEILDPATEQWVMVDPTFGLSMRRAADGGRAVVADMTAATRARNWTAMDYEFLSSYGDSIARGYYLDYPFLFVLSADLEAWVRRDDPPPETPPPIADLYTLVGASVAGHHDLYAVRCLSGRATIELQIDGELSELDCTGLDGFSRVFFASSIASTGMADASFEIYRPRRVLFDSARWPLD